MNEIGASFAGITIGFLIGISVFIWNPNILLLENSGSQLQTKYKDQTYILIPYKETECN